MSQIPLQYWSFVVGGMVDVPLPLSYADLLSLPETEVECAIVHTGRSLNGPHLYEACWHGVAVAALLNEVHIQQGAHYAHLYAANGYATSVTLSALNRAVLAYRADDDILSPEQGYPIRLILPGLYGYKMPRQIQRIMLAAEPLQGTWETRGWPSSGQVEVLSFIQQPQHRALTSGEVTISGLAFAGERAVSLVEISINDGPFMPAPFTQASPYTFARWSVQWEPPAPGDYIIRARAADSAGSVQPDPHTIRMRAQE